MLHASWPIISLISLLVRSDAFSSFSAFTRASQPTIFQSRKSNFGLKMEVFEGNEIGKFAWKNVWKLDLFKRGAQGEPCTFGDMAHIFRTNIEQIYGNEPSIDGCPVAEGVLDGIQIGSLFLGIQKYYKEFGPAYKLCFGPKSFIVISDPVMAKYILKENAKAYDKGVLAEILEPIMGKGLIPADPVTWKVRRRAIVPGFHTAWLNAMINVFGNCNASLIKKLDSFAESNKPIEMESHFCSLSLDIIGKSIFNYEFESVTNESPIIKAVYSVLKEAEHRSMTPAPYWDIPFANSVVPRLREFNRNLRLLNNVLDDLINRAKNSRQETDLEDLQERNYEKVNDASMLRFLVDLRGEDVSNKQLRDDLMTMLIAGHETTAAVLTWAFFEMSQNKEIVKKAQHEVDSVIGDKIPTYEDIKNMPYIRNIISESLRMYPEPPLLIRRALEDHSLPMGSADFSPKIIRGTDIFLSVFNIHRSSEYFEKPDEFDPERFAREFKNERVKGWKGFIPDPESTQLYPNEVISDFAFLPFGGGQRKCVGDQFALMESAVTMAMLIRRFEFDLAVSPEQVRMTTGATIHTMNGMPMRVKKRNLKKNEEFLKEGLVSQSK